jgi:hypothetical protein
MFIEHSIIFFCSPDNIYVLLRTLEDIGVSNIFICVNFKFIQNNIYLFFI